MQQAPTRQQVSQLYRHILRVSKLQLRCCHAQCSEAKEAKI